MFVVRALIMVICVLWPFAGTAQILPIATITHRFATPVPADGPVVVTVRWYAEAVGGEVLHWETQTVDVRDSIAEIPLGRLRPIPDNVWNRGARFLGLSVEANAERMPRLELVPVPMALAARRADVADRLSPDITGVVTSINEAAGGLWLVGEHGISVTRRGSVFAFSASSADSVVSGSIDGDQRNQPYYLRLPLPLRHVHDLRLDVVMADGSHVGVNVSDYDPQSNTVALRCTAILTSSDHIRWSYRP
jgi:hypothetical protein